MCIYTEILHILFNIVSIANRSLGIFQFGYGKILFRELFSFPDGCNEHRPNSVQSIPVKFARIILKHPVHGAEKKRYAMFGRKEETWSA